MEMEEEMEIEVMGEVGERVKKTDKILFINVHVKEKTIAVQCGDGTQRVIWLAHVGLARYDSKYGLELGVPKGVKRSNGEKLDANSLVKDVLKTGQHVFVMLRGDDSAAIVDY